MKRLLLLAVLAAASSGCAQHSDTSADPKQAYRNCIAGAEGQVDKVKVCQSMLQSLKQDEQHRAFAEKESVRVLDYQRCLNAAETGVGENEQPACQKIWQEIRNH
ncbi:ChiQ/YbfN family lipoprotein [Pseudomonas nicosulfuronedens]